MRQMIYGFIACMVFLSCSKDENGNGELNGTYTGTFQRIGANSPGVANVTLTFNGNKFNGESSEQYYPAICNGTVSVKGNKAEFTNACVWPAHFDWSLILNGEYDIFTKGDSLIITRTHPAIFRVDKYALVKQPQ